MHDLLKLQKQFFSNTFNQDNNLDFISSDFPQERFDIYRGTIIENMINALKITYPGIWTLIGDECANGITRRYCQSESNLPSTGCLDDFGGNFPEFLLTIQQLNQIPYLKDYARYEWLKHLAYHAPDSTPFHRNELLAIKQDDIGQITFRCTPSVHLFQSKYPLSDIHQIVLDSSAKEIPLKEEDTYGIVSRKENEIYTYWVPEGDWLFVKNLASGSTLEESAIAAQSIPDAFDLSAGITFVLQSQLVDKIIYKGENNVGENHSG